MLAPAISGCNSLSSLNIARNSLWGYDRNYDDWEYSDGYFDMTGVKAIADSVRVSTSLTSLDLSSNILTIHGKMDGIEALADMLRVSTSLTSLNLSSTALCGVFESPETTFDIGEYDVASMLILADALSVSTSMTKLNIWDNMIGEEGATAIVNAAPAQMRTLCGDLFEEGQTQVDLSRKMLKAEGMILVAWNLRASGTSASITSLNLSSNLLCGIHKYEARSPCRWIYQGTYDTTGLMAITGALSVISSLTSLNVANNHIGGRIESDLICGKSWAMGDVVDHEGFTWTCTHVNEFNDRELTRYDMTGIKAIADVLNVSTSLKMIKCVPSFSLVSNLF